MKKLLKPRRKRKLRAAGFDPVERGLSHALDNLLSVIDLYRELKGRKK